MLVSIEDVRARVNAAAKPVCRPPKEIPRGGSEIAANREGISHRDRAAERCGFFIRAGSTFFTDTKNTPMSDRVRARSGHRILRRRS